MKRFAFILTGIVLLGLAFYLWRKKIEGTALGPNPMEISENSAAQTLPRQTTANPLSAEQNVTLPPPTEPFNRGTENPSSSKNFVPPPPGGESWQSVQRTLQSVNEINRLNQMNSNIEKNTNTQPVPTAQE